LNQIIVALRSMMWRILDFITGTIFIYAGAIKAFDPVGFANDIDNYKSLPWMIAIRLAFYLPWLEVFCGLALVTRRCYLGALSLLTLLTSIFIVATIVAKARGIDIACGCFGHASRNWSFTSHLLLDFGLLVALLLLLGNCWRKARLEAGPPAAASAELAIQRG